MADQSSALSLQPHDSKIDVDEKGSLDKATVYAGLEDAGEGNYDTVRRLAVC